MTASCVSSRTPWHIVLVLDDSGSMSGQPSQDVNEAIEELICELCVASMGGRKPYFKVSVVSFGSSYHTIAEAVSETDLEKDLDAVANFGGNSGSTNAAAALDEAARILTSHPGQETDFEPFVFFLSDGHSANESEALKAAKKIKNLSLPPGAPKIIALGFGRVDDSFMASIASNGALYRKLDSPRDIVKLLPAIGTIASNVTGGAESIEEAIMKL